MENEIKVGEYIRINNDFRLRCIGIGKVRNISIVDGTIYADMDTRELSYSLDKKQVSKHGKNPIDVIEVGDYVNGMLVIEIINQTIDDITKKIILVNRDSKCTLKPLAIYENSIKTIVTKEQFESISYKVTKM